MPSRGRNIAGVIIAALAVAAPAIAVPGFTEPAGYIAKNLNLNGSIIALSPGGRLAVAYDNAAGGGVIRVYDQAGPGRLLLGEYAAPSGAQFKFFGGITWKDENTLLFSENGSAKTAFSATLFQSGVTPLAPLGSLPNVQQLAIRPDQSVLAVQANAPGFGSVSLVNSGAVSPYLTNLGTGYLTGIALRPDGSLYVGDTNDPNFSGNAGQIHRFNPLGQLDATLSLAGGGGSGLYDFIFDSEGDLIATTGNTLTQIKAGQTAAANFGAFDGIFNFPTALAYRGVGFDPNAGSGTLLINGVFTSSGDILQLNPVPEPGALAGLGAMLGLLGLSVIRKRSR